MGHTLACSLLGGLFDNRDLLVAQAVQFVHQPVDGLDLPSYDWAA